MFSPIQKEHESCCPNCGCVLKEFKESMELNEKPTMPPSINNYLLGSAFKYNLKRDPKQVYEERTLKLISNLIKEFDLPESFIFDVFNIMKKRNSGFRSDIEPIKQLIRLLSKDDNYIYIHKLKAIKIKYENLIHN